MKLFGLRLVLQIAMLAFVFAATARANDGLQAKLEYCTTCHGMSGQGYHAYYTMPRLAGQQPKYIENQLHAFIEHRRLNPIMFNVAHALDPSMVNALAAHFRSLNPRPYGGEPRGLIAAGKTLFDDGVPEANIPACFACHGERAEGHDEIPRLASQLYWYIVKVLSNWGKERGQGTGRADISALMAPTAHNLNHSQIEAIAAYVSSLK